jgi:Molybdopterin biosynthesis enzyme
MDRKTYIDNIPVSEALEKYFGKLDLKPKKEIIPTKEALGRITAAPAFALFSDPPYNASAMDGIAVVAEKTKFASDKYPLVLTNDEFRYINTGNRIPEGFDSVIVIEDVLMTEAGAAITSSAYPWQNIRVTGESAAEGEMLVSSGKKLRPVDLAALTAAGNTEVEVYKSPKVAVIPTGGELTDDPALLSEGRLMESNSKMFSGLISELGGEPVIYPITEDGEEALSKALADAIKNSDVILINAGSSAGTKDHAFSVISRMGEVAVHGLAIKPGKPAILGIVGGKPVIGVPGYPVSAYIVFNLVVKPILEKLTGYTPPANEKVEAVLTKRLPSTLKSAEYIRVAVGSINGARIAAPMERGAAAIAGLARADGFIIIPRSVEGFESGEKVTVELFKPLSEIDKNLVIVGSHDLLVDLVAEKIRVTSAHVGSLAGLISLSKGECEIAPIHLLDEETGEYNVSYVKKYLGGRAVLIKGVGRVQGFMTKGSKITSFREIADKKLFFANRQRGSGTRILTDFILKKEGVGASEIVGYEKEFTNHLSVASAVRSGSAGVGVGIAAAAKGLGFYPFAEESYDFAILKENLNDPKIAAFLEVLKSDYLKDKLNELGGYTFGRAGDIIEI